MALVTGPLHSQSASGQLGKTLIYQPSRGQNVVRAYGKPNWTTHPPTADQLAVQAMNKLLMEHWPDIDPEDQATWEHPAAADNISRVNAYLRTNFRLLRGGQAQSDTWPPDETPPAGPTVALIVTAGDPAPDPDCTGDYEQIDDYSGYSAYTRISDQAFYIYMISDLEGRCLSQSLGTAWADAQWHTDSTDPNVTYEPNAADGYAMANYP